MNKAEIQQWLDNVKRNLNSKGLHGVTFIFDVAYPVFVAGRVALFVKTKDLDVWDTPRNMKAFADAMTEEGDFAPVMIADMAPLEGLVSEFFASHLSPESHSQN